MMKTIISKGLRSNEASYSHSYTDRASFCSFLLEKKSAYARLLVNSCGVSCITVWLGITCSFIAFFFHFSLPFYYCFLEKCQLSLNDEYFSKAIDQHPSEAFVVIVALIGKPYFPFVICSCFTFRLYFKWWNSGAVGLGLGPSTDFICVDKNIHGLCFIFLSSRFMIKGNCALVAMLIEINVSFAHAHA